MTTTPMSTLRPLGPFAHPPTRAPQPPDAGGAAAPFREALRRVAEGVSADERAMDRAVRVGSHGPLAPEALIALQARVYRHTQELELGSKVVDKAAGALKQTLQSQQ